MRMSARSLGTATLAITLVIGGMWWITRKTSIVNAPIASEVPVSKADTDASVSPAFGESPFAGDHLPRATLPPANTSLDSLWSTLQGPAQAGDAPAACRLAIETIRCINTIGFASATAPPSDERGELHTLLDFVRSPWSFRSNDESEYAQERESLEDFSARKQVAAQRCEGTSPERAKKARDLLRAAALAGQPDAQAAYAAGEGWFLSIPGSMAGPEFDQWRSEAPLVIARMLEAGHPDAPSLLAGAYSNQTWLGGLYDYDNERAATYLTLSTRLMGKPEMADQQLRDASPAVRARARQQADALYAQYYQGRPIKKATHWMFAGTRLAQPSFGGHEITPAPCAPPVSSATPAPSGAP